MFVDALNTAQYEKVENFFLSDSFKQSLTGWNFNWVFSCREAVWNEWSKSFTFQRKPLVYQLKKFTNGELIQALETHSIDLTQYPNWLVQKLKWPGLLRLCEKIYLDKPDLLTEVPPLKSKKLIFNR